MDLLYEAGTPDLIGTPMRVCLEPWITGMWVLGVGQPALDILFANYQVMSNKLIKTAGLGLELFEDIEDAPQLPNVADRTEAVADRLVAEGDEIVFLLLARPPERSFSCDSTLTHDDAAPRADRRAGALPTR
jgi:hypothetical protein